MFIPKTHIITLEVAKAAPIGVKITAANLILMSPKHCYLSSFLLQERTKTDSFWRPFLDILPQFFNSFPIFYSPAEKSLLSGSPFLDTITEKLADIEEDYSAICRVAPEFAEYPIEEFSRMRMAVSSRIFGMEIDGLTTDGFVPLADMLNHRRPRQTSWTYDQERGGFTIEALEDIQRGEEVMDSYGRKCNYRFLLNYGFVNRDNDADEYPLQLALDPNDQYFLVKLGLAAGKESFTVRIMASTSERCFEELFGFLRFIEFDDKNRLAELIQLCTATNAGSIKPTALPKISVNNEKRALLRLKALMEERLSLYSTSLEQDVEMLKTQQLTENERNIVMLRKGEKVVLHWHLQLVETCLPLLLSADIEEFKRLKKTGTPYDDYISSIVAPLVRAGANG